MAAKSSSLWDATLPLQLTTAPPVQLQWQKLSVAKGLAKDDADMKTKGKKVRLELTWLPLFAAPIASTRSHFPTSLPSAVHEQHGELTLVHFPPHTSLSPHPLWC